MYQLDGCKSNSNLVCKLNKSLYGLKQAPKCWNSLFHKVLIGLGLKRSQKDPCLYFNDSTFLLVDNKEITFLGLEIIKVNNELHITQKELIEKILIKFNMLYCKTSNLPMQPKLQLSANLDSVNNRLP